MDDDRSQSGESQTDLPMLEYGRQGGRARPEVERNCEQAIRIAVVSLLFPPAAIVAFIKAGWGLAEVGRSGKAGRGHAVLAIALGILLPCLFGLAAWSVWRARSSADVVMCQSNLRTLGQLVLLYESEFPAAVGTDIDEVVRMGGDGQKVPTCVLVPHDEIRIAGEPVRTTYMLLPRKRRLNQIPNIAVTVLAVDLSSHPRDRGPLVCLLFCDGHSEAMHPEEANRLIAASIPVLMSAPATTVPAAQIPLRGRLGGNGTTDVHR